MELCQRIVNTIVSFFLIFKFYFHFRFMMLVIAQIKKNPNNHLTKSASNGTT